MAEIRNYWLMRHLRGEASHHLAVSRAGRTVQSGRGLSGWFFPMSDSVWEVPVNDRDLDLMFLGRTTDFQQMTTQGVLSWRIAHPERAADRIDFTLDLRTGTWANEPLHHIEQLLTQLAQQAAWAYLTAHTVDEALAEGVAALREVVGTALGAEPLLDDLGIEVVAVRIQSIRPTAEMEKALQTPTRERVQQSADKATYERRAMAVERERAIQDNEIRNKIELAKRTEELIAQEGQNAKRRIAENIEGQGLKVVAKAERAKIDAVSQADTHVTVETAKTAAEQARIALYRDLPPGVLMGLSLHEVAQNLPAVEHLTLSPELIGPALSRLAERVG